MVMRPESRRTELVVFGGDFHHYDVVRLKEATATKALYI
jgi:hypothetical protein